MISYIRGELAAQYEDKVIVDVGGVGYGIYMSAQSMSKLPPVGSEVKIHTYLNVKEDSMQLFGFLTVDDLNVFKLLIGVSGIGPKGGQAILSVLSPDDLRFAVMADDVKAISSAPGIGKKTAQKLIVELKDKLSIRRCSGTCNNRRWCFKIPDVNRRRDSKRSGSGAGCIGIWQYRSTESCETGGNHTRYAGGRIA